jgi:hypothetical protein
MNIRIGRSLATLTTIAIVTVLPVSIASAAGTGHNTTRALSIADAPFYLDVHDKIPASFRQLTPDEATAQFGEQDDPDSAAVGYTTEGDDAILMLQLTVGKGRSAWSVFEHDVAQAEEMYRGDDLAKTLVDADLPSDQISVAPPEWTHVAVGDSARTALFNIDVAQLGTIHFEMLVMAVRTGPDAALVVVAHGFATAPSFAVADVASEVAARIKSGPPTPERTIAEAGLVTIGDLPVGWQERTDESNIATSSPTSTGSTGTVGDSTGGDDNSDQMRKLAKSIPACKMFASVLDGSGSGVRPGATTGSNEFELDGATFGLGPATVTSQVSVYPSSATATEFFRVLRAPSTKACVTKLYARATKAELETAAKGSGKHGSTAANVRVEVTTPRPSPVGDERLLFRVSAELPSMGHVRVVSEQEYVRTGRAVARYTFSDVGKVTVREDVVRAVSERIATAPGVR